MAALNFSSSSKTESGIKTKVGYVEVSTEKAKELRQSVKPLTLPYTDAEGRTIQLWNSRKGLVASVTSDDGIVIVSGNNVLNPLQASEGSHQLIRRLETCGLRKWQFSYSETTKKIVIWPHMVAAGKDGPAEWKPPTFAETPDVLGQILKKR